MMIDVSDGVYKVRPKPNSAVRGHPFPSLPYRYVPSAAVRFVGMFAVRMLVHHSIFLAQNIYDISLDRARPLHSSEAKSC
jgi:hypothetical protein